MKLETVKSETVKVVGSQCGHTTFDKCHGALFAFRKVSGKSEISPTIYDTNHNSCSTEWNNSNLNCVAVFESSS